MATPERTEFSGDWVNGKYHLQGEELQTAAEVWMKYVASYDAVSEVFDRHCTDPEGLINQATVKLVMQELLGEAPSDEDVSFVVAECSMVVTGKLSKPGFITAMSLFEMDQASDCPHISREKLRTHYNDKLVGMCVCVCVCYIHIHTYIHTYIHTGMHTYIYYRCPS